jgi:hypothetical protein
MMVGAMAGKACLGCEGLELTIIHTFATIFPEMNISKHQDTTPKGFISMLIDTYT